MRTRWSLAMLGLLCACLATADEPRLDLDGDPLPPAALYRLGTKLWRHPGNAHSPSWSADGKRLAMVCNSREIRILDGETGKLVLAFNPKDEAGTVLPQCFAVALAPSGEELAVRAMPARVICYEAATGKHRQTLTLKVEDFGDSQGALCYSPDGKLLAASFSQSYEVLTRETGESLVKEQVPGQVRSLAFTADSSRLVVSAINPTIRVWDLAKGEIVKRSSDKQPEDGSPRGVGVSPDGNLVASGGRDVSVYDLEADKVAIRLPADEPSEQFVETAFTPDGKLLLAATQQQGTVYVWNRSDWSRKWKLATDAYYSRGLAVRPDGQQVALTDARNRVWVWNLADGKLLGDNRPAHDASIGTAAFSADGVTLATGSDGKDTHLWDAATGKHRRHLDTSSRFLVFAKGGQQLITGWHLAPHLRTWDSQSGQAVGEWTSQEQQMRFIALSADQSHLAVMQDRQQPVRGYRVQRLTFPALKPAGTAGREGYARGLTVSRDASLAIVGAQYGIEMWNVDQGTLVAELPGQNYATPAIAVTADDRYLIDATPEKTIRVLEMASLRPAHVLEGHKQIVMVLALSPNGRMLASSDGATSWPPPAIAEPRQIRFWNLATGQQVAELPGLDADVTTLEFSPAGSRLVAGLRDTTAIVWDVPAAARKVAFAHQPLSAADAAALWDDLGSSDTKLATAAIARLAQDPQRAVALAGANLAPAGPLDEALLAELVQGLDAEEFADRRAAFDKLAVFGAAIEPQLKAVVAATESGEIKLRCGELLNLMQRRYPQSGRALAQTRAVQLLEWIDDKPARALLAKLGVGAAEAHLTKEVKAALSRLKS